VKLLCGSTGEMTSTGDWSRKQRRPEHSGRAARSKCNNAKTRVERNLCYLP